MEEEVGLRVCGVVFTSCYLKGTGIVDGRSEKMLMEIE